MDTLSQLLQATRARSPLVADIQLGIDVSVGLPALGGIPFHYVAKGSCWLDTDDNSVALEAGDFVMLARMPFYRLRTGSGARRVEAMDFAERDKFSIDDLRTGRDRILAREFGGDPVEARVLSAILMPGDRWNSPLMRELPTVTVLRDSRALLEPWLVAAIDFMSVEIEEPGPGLSAIAERLIEVIFIAVLRKWLLGGTQAQGWMRGLTEPAISRVLNVMHAEPGRRWTLRDLAKASGRSRSGLAKHFHEVMGETPFVYLTRWRMDLAAAALIRGDQSVADIGVGLGYGGSSAFSRTFATTFGMSPAQYRRGRGKGTVA